MPSPEFQRFAEEALADFRDAYPVVVEWTEAGSVLADPSRCVAITMAFLAALVVTLPRIHYMFGAGDYRRLSRTQRIIFDIRSALSILLLPLSILGLLSGRYFLSLMFEAPFTYTNPVISALIMAALTLRVAEVIMLHRILPPLEICARLLTIAMLTLSVDGVVGQLPGLLMLISEGFIDVTGHWRKCYCCDVEGQQRSWISRLLGACGVAAIIVHRWAYYPEIWRSYDPMLSSRPFVKGLVAREPFIFGLAVSTILCTLVMDFWRAYVWLVGPFERSQAIHQRVAAATALKESRKQK